MLTEASEMLTLAEHIRPNDLDASLKERWLREAEGLVQSELAGRAPSELFVDGVLVLSAPVPYDRLYLWYLCAMIDLAQGDAALYQNDMAVYNAAFHDYAKWLLRQTKRADV